MTTLGILPKGTRRSRYLFDWSASACLASPEQSLNAITDQTATFSRNSTKTAHDENGVVRTVPYGLPAFHWTIDPVSGLMVPGLLLEDTRTNLLLRSDDFSNASWSKANVTVTTNQIAAPDGSLTADKIAATATAATTLSQSFTATAVAHTYSLYVKQGSGATVANAFVLYNNTTAANIAAASLNYATGVLTVTLGTGTVTALPNGWYRITLTATSGITIGNTLSAYAGFAGASATAGDYLYAWGAQVDAGAAVSSYIPTTSATVARTADALSWSFKALPQAMTIYVKFVELGTLSTGATTGLLGIGASTNAALMVLNNGAGLYQAAHRVGSDVTSTLAAAPIVGQSTEIRAALSATGTILIGQSIAGATETLGATSAALALASAWFDTTLTANERGGSRGYISLQSLKIAAGSQTLATMRQG